MIKKNVFFIFLFIAVILLSFPVLHSSSAASKKSGEKIFFGRVIFVADSYIEVKRGKVEFKVYFTDDTKFIFKDRQESGKNSLRVCQYVEVYYADGTKKILNKLIIKKESDCIK